MFGLESSQYSAMKYTFQTKARTLAQLEGKIKCANVLPMEVFTVEAWRKNPNHILDKLRKKKWAGKELIVRSSSVNEDKASSTLAGHYRSVLGVSGDRDMRDAIETVVESFGEEGEQNEVFIQPMLKEIALAGVAFSRDPSTGGDYIVLSYDDFSGRTDTVTAGITNLLHTEYISYFAKNKKGLAKKVTLLLHELQKGFGVDDIDIEFCIDKNDLLFLLQVRPLFINNDQRSDSASQKKALSLIETKIRDLQKNHPYLHGDSTVFGVMPDWNPAEIIGIRPRPLSLSLYRDLVTDSIWAYQRDNYGYKNLRSFPLLVDFFGLPYIDIRTSFNSFLPRDLSDDLSGKLVNYYLQKLLDSPENHDKVEFEIIFSCYALDTDSKLSMLEEYGFSSDEIGVIRSHLLRLTNSITHEESGLWKLDIKKISELELRHREILGSELDRVAKIYWLLEYCKRYGTLPFAGLARAGFIAIQLLNSLSKINIITESERDEFLYSLNTISTGMTRDLTTLSREEFISKYGHLRPGTYDIRSARYDEEPDSYFNWEKAPIHGIKKIGFSLDSARKKLLEMKLSELGISHTPDSFLNFIRSAVEGREYAKFVFTKTLSDVLVLIEELGAEYGLTKEECSYLDIEHIKKLYSTSGDVASVLMDSKEKGKIKYRVTESLVLPPLITDPNDVFYFEIPESVPNFVTLGKVSGKIHILEGKIESLDNMIVMMEAADPGFDWIFSHNVRGFITKYGGVNSHMAIRAAELQVPAVIGAGEKNYERWAKADMVELDCQNRQVRILK